MVDRHQTIPLVFILVTLALPATADIPIILVADVEFAPTEAVSLLIVPDGAGDDFAAARIAGGQRVDATIRFRLVDEFGSAIYLFPREDVWLELQGGTINGCSSWTAFVADDHSAADGGMDFALARHAGGWSPGPTMLMIAGGPAWELNVGPLPPFPLAMNSPDITGDLLVNLADIALFVQDLGSADSYRSDFDWNGAVDLTDIVIFAQHLGAICP